MLVLYTPIFIIKVCYTLLYQPHNVIHLIFFFISALYSYLFFCIYGCFTFIFTNYYFIQGFSQLFLFSLLWITCRTIGIKNLCIKKVVFLHSYIIALYLYLREYYFFNNLEFVNYVIVLLSLLSFVVIFNNLIKSEGKKFSLYNIFNNIRNFCVYFFIMPKPYFSLILISLLFAKIIRLGLLSEVMLNDYNIFHYYFCLFSLIVPSIYIFRIVLAVLLNYQTSFNGCYIGSLIIYELLNIRNYRLDYINFNNIGNILIIFTFGFFLLDVIPCLGINMSPQSLDDTVFKIFSSNEININNSSHSSPTNSNWSFGSFVFADHSPQSPIRPFEQKLWLDRFDTLGDAKALDLSKRILLNKICIARNIGADLQLYIQDYIWGNHWYELYSRHYTKGEYGIIRRLPYNYYHDENGKLTYASNGWTYDEDGKFIVNRERELRDIVI